MLNLFEYFKIDNRISDLFDRVRAELISSGHEVVWQHTLRVINNLYSIAKLVDFNFKTALIAAICHDIGYNEVVNGHEQASVLMMKKILDTMYDNVLVGEIIHCIEAHECDGNIKPQTIEAMALHDADMLDYCSERGIINAFVLGQSLGLSEAGTAKRVVKVIEERFLIKQVINEYGAELNRTEKFFINVVTDLNKERSGFNKNMIK
ncbi:MAG: HD domain-containing protein [Candidatus Nanoarchaeia archaeon]|jgi:HD superfamily phosphodiesterase